MSKPEKVKTGFGLHPENIHQGGRHKSLRTLQWEELGEYLMKDGAQRYMGLLASLPDQEFMDRFENILEYFRPKRARQEITIDTELPIIQISTEQFEEAQIIKENGTTNRKLRTDPDIPGESDVLG